MAANPQLRGFAMPLSFTDRADLITRENGQVSIDTARNAVLTLQQGIPLCPLGTIVPLLAFDPQDDITLDSIRYQAARGVAAGAPAIEMIGVEQVEAQDQTVQVRVDIKDQRLSQSELSYTMLATGVGWDLVPLG